MTDGTTATARLERLLHVLPAASREGGAALDELAGALGTSRDRIVADIREVTERVYYHPGGWPDDILVQVTAERVEVRSAGGLDRPVRLSPEETLCLAMGLRGTSAAAHVADAGGRAALLARAEAHLAVHVGGRAADGGRGAGTSSAPIAALDLHADESEVRQEVLAAARDRRSCAIVYAKADAPEAEARVIHPYTLVYAEGAWYVVGWCTLRDAMRVFRTDRILEACRTEDAFDPPGDFRAEEWVEGGRVFRATREERVRVRYSPRIARWVREHAENEGWTLEEEADGSVVMEHGVADPHWVARHALHYGGDAEVIEPGEYRALVRDAVAAMRAEEA